MTHHHRHQLRARSVRRMNQAGEDHELVGQRRGDVAEEPQHVPGRAERVGDETAGDRWARPDAGDIRTRPPRRSCRRRRAAPRTGRRSRPALAVTTLPSARTRSTESRLSRARACLPMSQPRPPPSVRPAMPVVETTPPVVASPWSCVSRLNSFQVRPPCARAVRAFGST